MTEGTQGTRRRPQTGTARKASKAEHRRRAGQRAADERPLLTIDGAAGYLQVSRATVYRLISRGELATVVVGGRQRLRPVDIDDYLAAS